MGTMLQSIEAGQVITHMVQTSFKPSFPNFLGENPSGWIYRCDNFLKINGIEDYEQGRIGFLTFRRKGLGMVSRVRG